MERNFCEGPFLRLVLKKKTKYMKLIQLKIHILNSFFLLSKIRPRSLSAPFLPCYYIQINQLKPLHQLSGTMPHNRKLNVIELVEIKSSLVGTFVKVEQNWKHQIHLFVTQNSSFEVNHLKNDFNCRSQKQLKNLFKMLRSDPCRASLLNVSPLATLLVMYLYFF